jgi:hypothetical protein
MTRKRYYNKYYKRGYRKNYYYKDNGIDDFDAIA